MDTNIYQNQIKKKIVLVLILILGSILNISTCSFADEQGNEVKETTILIPTNIYGADDKGKYITDPVTWIRNGYNILVYDLNFYIRAQVFDQNGNKIDYIADYALPELGLRGKMFIFNTKDKCQKAAIQRPHIIAYTDYEVIINAGKANQTILVHVFPAGCDARGCHPIVPPRHIIEKKPYDNVKSRCNNCHNHALKIHTTHYNKVANNVTGCYICHPHIGCSIGLTYETTYNPHYNLTCVNCHGTLDDVMKGSFKMRAQRGLPRCDDCHEDKEYSYPKESTFKDSYGHGGVACVNCHAATHLASHTSIGYNACARACHTTQPYDSKMGPDCGKCHNSSVAPHLVKRKP
jgi:hypothetical protein